MSVDWQAVEQELRNEAQARRSQGVLGWDARLRASGFDPHIWSHKLPAGSRQIALMTRTAALAAASYDVSSNTVELTWSTGVAVTRQDDDGPFLELLDMSPRAVRLDRLNAGAPFLNSHASNTLDDIIGCVVPGTARIVGGRGVCRVALSTNLRLAGIVADIRGGVIRNVSVGYQIYSRVWTDGRNGALRSCLVTDWEPIEISAVPIPADANAQIREY